MCGKGSRGVEYVVGVRVCERMWVCGGLCWGVGICRGWGRVWVCLGVWLRVGCVYGVTRPPS